MKYEAPLILQVRISDTQTKVLEIEENECPTEAIERFCQENGLSSDHKKILLQGVLTAYEREKPGQESIEEDELEYEDYEVDQRMMGASSPDFHPDDYNSAANYKGEVALPKTNSRQRQVDAEAFKSKLEPTENGMRHFEEQLSKKNLRVKFVESEQKEQISKGGTLGQPNMHEAVFESKSSKNYEIHINSPRKGIQRTDVNIDPNLSRITHENVRTENSDLLIPDKSFPVHLEPAHKMNSRDTSGPGLHNLNVKKDSIKHFANVEPRETVNDKKSNRIPEFDGAGKTELNGPVNLRHEPLSKPGRSITSDLHSDPDNNPSKIQQKMTENVE